MNIGCVKYIKDFETGELHAEWYFKKDNKIINGKGYATGTPGDGFSGKYKITYIVSDTNSSNTYDFYIEKNNSVYLLEWYQNNEIKYSGIGMIYDNCLFAGWNSIDKQHQNTQN